MNQETLKKGFDLNDQVNEAQDALKSVEMFLEADKESFLIELQPRTYGIVNSSKQPGIITITKEELRPLILKNIENKKAELKQLESEFEEL